MLIDDLTTDIKHNDHVPNIIFLSFPISVVLLCFINFIICNALHVTFSQCLKHCFRHIAAMIDALVTQSRLRLGQPVRKITQVNASCIISSIFSTIDYFIMKLRYFF